MNALFVVSNDKITHLGDAIHANRCTTNALFWPIIIGMPMAQCHHQVVGLMPENLIFVLIVMSAHEIKTVKSHNKWYGWVVLPLRAFRVCPIGLWHVDVLVAQPNTRSHAQTSQKLCQCDK